MERYQVAGELNLSVVDREVQEDARRVEFTGNGTHWSQIYFQFEDPVNMRPLEVAGGRCRSIYDS